MAGRIHMRENSSFGCRCPSAAAAMHHSSTAFIGMARSPSSQCCHVRRPALMSAAAAACESPLRWRAWANASRKSSGRRGPGLRPGWLVMSGHFATDSGRHTVAEYAQPCAVCDALGLARAVDLVPVSGRDSGGNRLGFRRVLHIGMHGIGAIRVSAHFVSPARLPWGPGPDHRDPMSHTIRPVGVCELRWINYAARMMRGARAQRCAPNVRITGLRREDLR